MQEEVKMKALDKAINNLNKIEFFVDVKKLDGTVVTYKILANSARDVKTKVMQKFEKGVEICSISAI